MMELIDDFELEMAEVEINETYIDDDGMIRDRVKKVLMPTGNIILKNDEKTAGEE